MIPQVLSLRDAAAARVGKGMAGEFDLVANFHLTLRDENGNVKAERSGHNIITNAGKNAVRQQILGATSNGAQPAKFNYVALGVGTASETAGDTALGSENCTRQQDTSPDLSTNSVGVIEVTFGAGNGTGAVTEAGLFNASSSGTLLARKTFAVVNKGASDSLAITWTITVS